MPKKITNIRIVNKQSSNNKIAIKEISEQKVEPINQEDNNTTIKEKLHILKKGIIQILKCENKTDSVLTTSLIAMIVSFFLRVVALLGIVAFISLILTLVNAWNGMSWSGLGIISNILTILTTVLIGIAVLLYSLVIWGSATEIENEKDKHYIVSLFSSIVGLVALIIAFVALFNN